MDGGDADMRERTSYGKLMARTSLLGNYGAASGSLLLAWFLNFMLVGICRGTGLFLISMAMPQKPEKMAGLVLFGFCYLIGTVTAAVFMTGEFRICYQICSGRRAGTGDLFFALSCTPLRFAALWLVFILAGTAALVPGGMLFVLAMAGEGRLAGWLLSAGSLISVILELVILFWMLAALTEAMECLEKSFHGQGAWRIGECLAAGWHFVATEGWRLVCLCPGFLGMSVLGLLSLGLGFLWVIPYFFCTLIHLYRISTREENGSGFYGGKAYGGPDGDRNGSPFFEDPWGSFWPDSRENSSFPENRGAENGYAGQPEGRWP